MRPFEMVVALLLGLWIGWPLLPRRWRRLTAGPFALDELLPVVVVLTVLIHLVVEQHRWQMIPLYLLSLGAFTWSVVRLLGPWQIESGGRPALRALVLAAAALFLAAAVALPVLIPVPRMPQPVGPHPVGTTTLWLVDSSRTEWYGDDPAARRELMVQLWYPAAPNPHSDRAGWMEPIRVIGPAVAASLDLPSFFLGHLERVRTHSYVDAPAAEPDGDGFPVLLFSHGWGGFRAQNGSQMELLASRGYVVAAVEHTYGAVVTVFPDGRVATNNPAALPVDAASDVLDAAAKRLVSQWAADLGFVLDYLTILDSADPVGRLAGRLDLDRVGVLGHSTGGGAAIEFCGRDGRCRAVLAMDPYMQPVSAEVLERGLAQPLLAMFSQTWSHASNNDLFAQLAGHQRGPGYRMEIEGTAHYDFTDLPLLTPLAHALGLKGPLAGARVVEIVGDYSAAFLDDVLGGIPSPLRESMTIDYPEVTLETLR